MKPKKGKLLFVAYLTKTTGINVSGAQIKPSITFSQAFKILS